MTSIGADALVIGDIVKITHGLVPAEIVLLDGECSADESSLTGEGTNIFATT